MTGADWETLKEKGNTAFKNSSYEEAVRFYSEAIEANKTEPVLWSNRSAAYLKKGDFEQASEDARQAIELDKCFVKAYSRLQTALCSCGRFQEASAALQVGLSSITAPADVKALRELKKSSDEAARAIEEARKQIEGGDSSVARRVLQEPLRQFPDCATIAFLFAEATVASDPDAAIKLLTSFASSHSADPYYLYLRALALYYRGQDGFASAQNILRQTLEMDPDNSKARVLLKKARNVERHKEAGNAAFKKKSAQEAVNEYTSAVEVDPSNNRMNATLRGNRAAARMILNDYQGALLDCDFAINNGGAGPKMYARRSRIEENLDQYDNAVRDLQRAAEEDRSFEAELRDLKARAKRAKRKNYYKTLSLPQNESDQNAIKRAYKKACLQWHPDKWAHASEEEKTYAEVQFKEVGEAFNVLSDPQKKRLYDSGQLDNDVEGAGGMGGMPQGFGGNNEDFANIINMMFGGGGGGGGGGATFSFQQQGFPGGFQQQGFQQGGRRRQRGFQGGFYGM